MTNMLLVLCACGSAAEAETISRALVESRLAACVQALAPMRSTYWWQGKIESAEEHPLLIKTTREKFDAVRAKIEELHSYEVPEIVAIPVEDASLAYLKWLGSELNG